MTTATSSLDNKLYDAAEQGDAAAVERLLAMGADPAARCPRPMRAWNLEMSMLHASTAARAAAREGHLDCVKLLAHAPCPNDRWPTSIQLAAAHGHLDCVEFLALSRPQSLSEFFLPYGPPPVLLAAWFGSEAVLRRLLEMGASPEMPQGVDPTPEIQPPLVLAAGRGIAACVQILLEFGADPEARGLHGDRAIDQAALQSHAACVAALRGVSDLLGGGGSGARPLELALRQSTHDVVEALCPTLADALDPSKSALIAAARQAAAGDRLPGLNPRPGPQAFLLGRLRSIDEAIELAQICPAPSRRERARRA